MWAVLWCRVTPNIREGSLAQFWSWRKSTISLTVQGSVSDSEVKFQGVDQEQTEFCMQLRLLQCQHVYSGFRKNNLLITTLTGHPPKITVLKFWRASYSPRTLVTLKILTRHVWDSVLLTSSRVTLMLLSHGPHLRSENLKHVNRPNNYNDDFCFLCTVTKIQNDSVNVKAFVLWKQTPNWVSLAESLPIWGYNYQNIGK